MYSICMYSVCMYVHVCVYSVYINFYHHTKNPETASLCLRIIMITTSNHFYQNTDNNYYASSCIHT